MSHSGTTTFTKYELMAIVAITSAGLTAIVAIGGGSSLAPITFILGVFILLPLIYVMDDRFPLVESPAEIEEAPVTPTDALRNSYATGEITDEEFERRLDRLLETEGDTDPHHEETDRRSETIAERD